MKRKQPITLFREAWVWSHKEEKLYRKLCVGFTLHLCCGTSRLGDVRCDLLFPSDVKGDMYHLPFRSHVFDTVICDPPWHGPRTWKKWLTLMREISRVSKRRVIFILGNLIYRLPKPWKLKHVFILKRVSPQVKLVYVWTRPIPLGVTLTGPRENRITPL